MMAEVDPAASADGSRFPDARAPGHVPSSLLYAVSSKYSGMGSFLGEVA
jgi:hypothetical protein